MRLRCVAVFAVLVTSCAEKWDLDATAREQCALAEMEMRKFAQAKMEKSIAFRDRVLALKDPDPGLLSDARRDVDRDIARVNMPRDVFMDVCRGVAVEALAPCVKDFRPNTPAAAACVEERALVLTAL